MSVVALINDAYGSSGLFGSIVRSKSLYITNIHAEELIFFKQQDKYTEQFINMIWMIQTWEVTSVGYHKQFLKN